MIKKIKDIVKDLTTESDKGKIVIVDSGPLEEALNQGDTEPDMRTLGLFTTIEEEKNAELIHGMLYLHETNRLEKDTEQKTRPSWQPRLT